MLLDSLVCAKPQGLSGVHLEMPSGGTNSGECGCHFLLGRRQRIKESSTQVDDPICIFAGQLM